MAKGEARYWDVLAAYGIGIVAGLIAGLSLAAAALALAGQTLFDLSAEQAALFLVGGPLLGLLPLSVLALVASHRPPLAAHLPFVLGIWLLLAVAATGWFGLGLLR